MLGEANQGIGTWDVLSATFDSKNLVLKTIPGALWVPKEHTAEIWLHTGRHSRGKDLNS